MKNKKIFIILLVSFSFLIPFSCKKESNNNPVPASHTNQSSPFFIFGKVGNSWIDHDSSTGINDTLSFELIEKSNNIYKFQVIHLEFLDTAFGYWYISDTEFAFSNDSLGNDRQTILKSDADADSTYLYVSSSEIVKDKVISKSVNITVPAGTFICYEIMETQDQQPDTGYYFISKDAGIVKLVSNIDNYVFKMLSKKF